MKVTSSNWRSKAKGHIVIQQRFGQGGIGTYRARKGGNGIGGAIALVGILSVVLGARVDDVCEDIPHEDFRRPLAEHPMGI